MLITSTIACSQSSNGSGGQDRSEVKKISINANADRYVKDESQNDNLTILRQECYLSNYATPKVNLYFSSEFHGAGTFMEDSFYIPAPDAWDTNNEYKKTYGSDLCNSAGLRDLQGKTLDEAIAGFKFSYLYGCGGNCEFKLVDRSLDETGDYSSIKFKYICSNVLKNRLAKQGPYGDVVDEIAGQVDCQTSM
jgi:hypothetical protein